MIWSILQSIADHNEMGNGFPFEEPGPQSKRLWLHSFRRNAQNIALQLQQQMFEILTKFEEQSNELNELREKLKKYETWDPDVDKYVLTDLGHNQRVYRLKQPQTPLDSSLSFCAYCFGNHKLVISCRLRCGRNSVRDLLLPSPVLYHRVVQSRSVRHRHLLVNFQSTSRKKF